MREIAIEGLIGTVALYFLVRYADGGIDGYWWACLAIFGVCLVSYLRTLWRAWSRRGQGRLDHAHRAAASGTTGNGADLDGE
ncbi:hypothetical protein Q9R29_08450 [Rothia sp. ARF10]|nr:hypothetical protein [Rothia sp. ARF10]